MFHYTDEEKGWTVDAVDEPSSLTVGTEWRKVPSMAVIETVAVATDRSQLELPPLQASIEVDALDDLLTGPSVSVIYVSFRYAGTTVTIGSDRSLVVDVQ
ncbi:HalOD1 output domain-containing protein [Halorubellus litoreus]|uniref:HalOD1 output domain-containing protein n=1 Tax=Halorubellus litoreus TaxID=755308 RepID=A0ABD5VLE8_9EURY